MTRRPTAQVPALVLALAVGFAAAAFATPALAQEPDRGMGWGYHLANELMSPYCPGRTLNDCPSSQAAELKSWILAQEQAGRSQAEPLAHGPVHVGLGDPADRARLPDVGHDGTDRAGWQTEFVLPSLIEVHRLHEGQHAPDVEDHGAHCHERQSNRARPP